MTTYSVPPEGNETPRCDYSPCVLMGHNGAWWHYKHFFERKELKRLLGSNYPFTEAQLEHPHQAESYQVLLEAHRIAILQNLSD